MCSDNKDCPGGQVCRDNHCQTECVVDDHCVGVNQICVNKKCVARDKDGGKNRELSWREPWFSYVRLLMFEKSWVLCIDKTFFTFIFCKYCIVCLKRPKVNEKTRVALLMKL